MAFSTQKGFFPLIELPQVKCVTKLKTYSSSTDHRSWSMDKAKQSQFLRDLVASRIHPPASHAGPPCEGCEDNQSSHLVGGDSLLNATVDELTRLEQLLLEKDDLKSQLEVSQEKLRVLNEEHQTVNAILTDEHCPEVASMLQRIIEQLKSSEKLDKPDENELTKLLDALIKRERSSRVLEAQNCYLRRLIEKLSTRCRLEAIHLEPEQSTDINYLQSQVDALRKEVCLLRELEDKHLKTETASRGIQGACEDSGLDAENVNKILDERNALREKCKNFAALTDKIYQWKEKAEQFEAFRAEACNALKNKDDHIRLYREDIEKLQSEVKKMEMCCRMKEQEEDNLCSSVDCLMDENRKLRQEISKCDVELRKVRKLQDQVQCLKKELCDKNCVIDQYDMQFQHVLGVVESLQRKDRANIVGLQDVHSQTPDEIEELAATTRLTLDQIHKELENRNFVECEMARSREELLEAKENLAKSAESLAKTEEDLDLANCEMKLLKKEKELQEALLRANNADCMKSIDELKAQLDQMEQENKLKLDEMEEVNKRKLEQMQADMEKERQAFANERGDFERQRQSWSKEKQSLMADCGEGDRLRAELEKERQAWVNERSDFFKEKETWEKERQSVAKLNADLSKEREDMERIKQDFDKARLAFDKERQDMQKEREGFASERKQFEQSSVSFEKFKQEMEKEKQDLEAKANHLADTLSKKEQRRLDSDTEMVNLRNQNDELNKQLKDCKNEVQAQKEKISKMSSELNSSQGQLKQADGLVKDISSVRDRNEHLSTVVKAADIDCQKLLAEERRKNADLQKQLATASAAANERKQLEKEIEGHRTSNNALRNSVSKLTSKINTRSAAEFERELILLLDNFTDEICKWRCEKNCKRLSKIQEIAKKICDNGLDCLTLKELVYMHQQMCEFGKKLVPAPCEGEQRRKERRCCKCTGEICAAPTIPSEHDLVLHEKLDTLERDIQVARENLRKLKKQQALIDLDEDQELETMRASTYRLNRGPRNMSAMTRTRFNGSIREEYDETPTKDRSGY